MITLQDNTGRGKAVKIFFYIMLAVNLISACSSFLQYSLLQNIKTGIAISASDASNNNIRQGLVALLLLAAITGSMITFIMWYYRAYKNLHALNITTLNFEAGWAIGAWFVPFLNMGRPYVIMRETWEETQDYYLPKEEKPMAVSSAIVGWWWGLYLTANIMAYIVTFLAKSSHGNEDLMTYTEFNIFYHAFNAGVLVVALLMLNQMQGYEKCLKEYVDEQNNLPPVSDVVREPVIPAAPSGNILNTTPE